MNTQAQIKEPGFFEYIFRNKQNQRLLLIAFAANIIMFFIFKMFCPNAFFVSDSNAYVLAAIQSNEVMYRPYGFSKFLQLVHSFSNGLDFFIWVQFLLLFVAGQFAFYSVDYLFRFKNEIFKKVSWFFITFNPILFLLANFVLSDAVFTALTVVYITLLLWVVSRPNWWVIILQAIVLYWAFQIRYAALYYPVLTVIAFLLSNKSNIATKAIGMLVTFLLIFASYKHIKSQVNEVTGVDVFSGFSGWQMANNVLGLYPHINTSADEFDTPEEKLLDSISHIYVDSIDEKSLQIVKDGKLISGFLWDKKGPLKVYLFNHIYKYRVNYFTSWYQVSEIFGDFGKTVIKNHPGAFFEYYLWPNTKNYFWPDSEDFGAYTVSNGLIPDDTKEWFDIKTKQDLDSIPDFQKVVSIYSTALNCLLAFLNLILPVLYYINRKKILTQDTTNEKKSVIFWWLMVGCNMAFSIFAAMIVLRYECLLLIIGFGFPMIMLDRLFTMRKTTQS
ncbi:hypothetical protein F0919_13815 [Taibaiella lutea]|uniref:Glycosyltransferase RgtA/B/C/D-like domain-containing protein n=1 Tax=Taibaiella lutea TaxID=2608001 RepID=A0A5M6CER5_9BACT|nr:hypothetical protein [Taibaiella lutea]KAA5533611.1 hypothetical protein F0919_13815 [Taibaiella lutea]